MTERGFYTKSEILSQPETWANSLAFLATQAKDVAALYEKGNYDQVIFAGCGSPFYCGRAAAALFQQQTGKLARAFPCSELFHYPDLCFVPNQRNLLVLISRSGETTEAIRACESFKSDRRGDIITISCYPDRPITRLGDINLIFPDAQENSLTQTRAFSTMYLVSAAMAFLWAGRRDLYDALLRLPAAGQSLLERSSDRAGQLGTDPRFSRFYFLGSGPRYGLACELSLKMKETSLAHSEPFHVLEYRHGPKAMVSPETLLLALVPSGSDQLEVSVAEETRRMGAEVVISGEQGVDVNFESGLPEAVQHVLHLPFGQLIAYHRSVSTGLNPDLPENLNAFVLLS